MSYENYLESIEKQWLKPAYYFLEKEFSNTPLPSHDHKHHYRVWAHAKKLLLELEKQGILSDRPFFEALLLSCMFHDSGMLKEKGNEHGSASVEIFQDFLKQFNDKPERTEEIIGAIKGHDDKSYYLTGRLVKDGKIQLLPALQISDDLDAYGYTGIYRYSEIYLLRGIPMEELGLKIIANLSGRYGYFMSNCSRIPEMIKINSMRQHTIESFFRHFNLQIRKKEETGQEPDGGPLAVVKNIYRQVMMDTPSMEEACINIIESESETYVKTFFTSLQNELESSLYPAD